MKAQVLQFYLSGPWNTLWCEISSFPKVPNIEVSYDFLIGIAVAGRVFAVGGNVVKDCL